jgi:hypothetical protein
MRSTEEMNALDMKKVMAAGPSAVRTFENYDEALFVFISNCLSAGKDVAINAAGPQNLMITAAHNLFRKRGEPLDQDKVHAAMDGLEKLRKCYHDDEGRELLTGGLDSWIYPEKYVRMAQKYRFVKHKPSLLATKLSSRKSRVSLSVTKWSSWRHGRKGRKSVWSRTIRAGVSSQPPSPVGALSLPPPSAIHSRRK